MVLTDILEVSLKTPSRAEKLTIPYLKMSFKLVEGLDIRMFGQIGAGYPHWARLLHVLCPLQEIGIKQKIPSLYFSI